MQSNPQLLLEKPNYDTRLKILNAFFRVGPDKMDPTYFHRFFKYYERELAMLNFGALALTSPKNHLLAESHEDLIKIVECLRSARVARSALCDRLKTIYRADDSAAHRTLDLVMRLWLTVNVREPKAMLQAPQTPLVDWQENQTIEDCISHAFPTSKWNIDVKENRLHPSFTAAFMVRVCGLKLEWTDCLADHLRLDRRCNVLRIYPYKSVLQAHLLTSITGMTDPDKSPLPERLVLETIWTLNLLFPQWDVDTNYLLKAYQQNFQQIGPYDGPPNLNLVEFQYWRDRLLEVHDVVFKSPPASWSQLWRDRRNPQQFWTFWLALVILLLTLISTITSIIQAWASVKALNRP